MASTINKLIRRTSQITLLGFAYVNSIRKMIADVSQAHEHA